MLETDDIVAIHQLLSRYGHVADGDLGELDQVFTDDAEFHVASGNVRVLDDRVVRGLDGLHAFFAVGKPPHPPAHQTTNVFVYEDDGAVRVRSKWIVVNPRTSELRLGDYDDLVVNTPAGWRIKERIATQRWPLG